ncbi:MAG TPA: DUF4129 domain-containing protein [Mycobacterium sp.]
MGTPSPAPSRPPGPDRATARAVALTVLLVMAGTSLRGYVPAAERASGEQDNVQSAMRAVVVVLLAVSLVIVALAVIHRMRNRRAMAGGITAFAARLGRPDGRGTASSRRLVLIGLAVLTAWLLLCWLLLRSVGNHQLDQFDQLAPDTGGNTGIPPGPETGTAPPALPGQQPEQPEDNPSGDMIGYLTAISVGMLVLIAAGIAFRPRARRVEEEPRGFDGEPRRVPAPAGAESLAAAAELGLAEVADPGREPREAIIRCYATMERELSHVPNAEPQDYDTPTEVLTRAVNHHALVVDNATRLVNLFAEARFSSHLMTESHRQEAVRVLRLVLDELRSPV